MEEIKCEGEEEMGPEGEGRLCEEVGEEGEGWG